MPTEVSQQQDVEYRELSRLLGYRFGDDGSAWSRWRSNAKIDAEWRRLRPSITNQGRSVVRLKTGPRRVDSCDYQLHRLILEAFIGPCPDGMEACHNDGDPANNRITNLRWDTHQANVMDMIRHQTRVYLKGSQCNFAKLDESDIPIIRRLRREGMLTIDIARRYGVDGATIRRIVARKRWRHVKED